jgi:hypothetical protein
MQQATQTPWGWMHIQCAAPTSFTHDQVSSAQPGAWTLQGVEPDALSPGWKLAIYLAILVPVVGSWIIVIVSSVMYYHWRSTFPNRAKDINKHGWLAWLAGNVLWLLIWASMSGFNHGSALTLVEDSRVTHVRDGTLGACPNRTVDQMAKAFMGAPTWESGRAADGTEFVNLSGRLTFSDKPVVAVVQFKMTEDGRSFELGAIEFDGLPQPRLMGIALLGKMCSAAGGGTDPAGSEDGPHAAPSKCGCSPRDPLCACP